MEQVIVDRVSCNVEILRDIEYFIDACPVSYHLCDTLVYSDGYLIYVLICRRRRCSNSKRTENLPRVAVVMGTYFGKQHIAFLKTTIRPLLSGYANRWVSHRSGSHIVNMGLTLHAKVG